MKKTSSCGARTDLITVVIKYPFSSDDEKLQLPITRLVFRNGTAAAHPVNQQTVDHFLKQAHIYGATVFPATPTAGCYAINGEYLTHAGEWPVSEIYFDGHLIYRIPYSTAMVQIMTLEQAYLVPDHDITIIGSLPSNEIPPTTTTGLQYGLEVSAAYIRQLKRVY